MKEKLQTIRTITGGVPRITRPDGAGETSSHRTNHHIVTTPGAPVALKPAQLARGKLIITKKKASVWLTTKNLVLASY